MHLEEFCWVIPLDKICCSQDRTVWLNSESSFWITSALNATFSYCWTCITMLHKAISKGQSLDSRTSRVLPWPAITLYLRRVGLLQKATLMLPPIADIYNSPLWYNGTDMIWSHVLLDLSTSISDYCVNPTDPVSRYRFLLESPPRTCNYSLNHSLNFLA